MSERLQPQNSGNNSVVDYFHITILILPIATKLPLRARGRVKHQNTSLTLHTAGDASTVQAVWTCRMRA